MSAPLLGVARWQSETHAEFGHRAGRTIGADGFPVLAELVTTADYSIDGVDEDEAASALTISDEVGATVRSQSTRQQRLLAALDPRPPDRRQPAARRHQAGPATKELPAIEVVRLPASSN